MSFTNIYVPIYIEDEFQKYNVIFKDSLVELALIDEQWNCPIDYIRNVDGGHRNDEKKWECVESFTMDGEEVENANFVFQVYENPNSDKNEYNMYVS